MSKGAYESYFSQAAPAGAVYGADISYWQGTDVWGDLVNWCDTVCIRTSYGSSGDDGRQAGHFNAAASHGFKGTLGTYHYIIPNSGWQGNASNYLSRSAPFVDRTKYDMLDFEESPVASNGFINAMCDTVEQTRQRPCLIYGGKSYLDQSGPINCPASKLWVAHYAARGSNAWQPTNDWNSWNAPLMPNQYGLTLPAVWQWSSSAIGYSLDLDISCTPSVFGIGTPKKEEDVTPEQANQLNVIYHIFTDDGRWPKLWGAADALIRMEPQLGRVLQMAERNNANYWGKPEDIDAPLPNALRDIADVADRPAPGAVDINALAAGIVNKLGPIASTDYERVRNIIAAELSELSLTANPAPKATEDIINIPIVPRRPIGLLDTPNGPREP